MNGARGYITVATGERRYLEMATDVALALREFDDKPVAVVLDDALRAGASARQLAVFDHVVPMPAGYPKFLGKFAPPLVTPFERNFFVDADCLPLQPLGPLWPPLDDFPFAAQGRYVTAAEDHEHHLLSTAAMIRQFGLGRYLRHNAGVLYFRRAPGAAVSEACMHVWAEGFHSAMPFDEPLRGIVGDRLGIATMPKPIAMAWMPGDVAPHDPKFRFIHFMGQVRADTLTWILKDVRRRREAAGLPWREAISAWLRKAVVARQEWLPTEFPDLAFRFPAAVAYRAAQPTIEGPT